MQKYKRGLLFGGFILVLLLIFAGIVLTANESNPRPWKKIKKHRTHFNHSPVFTAKFDRPQDVTLACLKCHPDAAKEIMKTPHWKWEREGVKFPGRDGEFSVGKKNLPNNFCLGVQGNERSCNSCHAGYGWKDKTFDFSKEENVDCLICHDWSGTYSKGDYGLPRPEVDLLAVAKSVGYPKRQNCGICHNYGGGGMGVKHGDLDESLINAYVDVDVHMSKNFICIDCHETKEHKIRGVAYSLNGDHRNGIGCEECHGEKPHKSERINKHIDSVACQTCHIPFYAKRAGTKMFWDWSKAGDSSRKEDPHKYLKIKGEFVYGENMIPEYYWFNLTVDRYLWNDKIDPAQITHMNPPRGDVKDKNAKIWPFKVHIAIQPYDKKYNYLLQPITAGEGGYWKEFNWDKAFRLAEPITGIKYSGSYGFAKTDMHWPLSHMVAPKNEALKCNDCHGANGRMNWKALGYEDDPIDIGGREKILSLGGAK
ncbi:MAG: Cytochrome c bacterial [Spirochaetes bacterium ADurb.Bin218]|jgi:octaheme c-type cytochrome (tetrathionate reductase family)|nr:tetrathionate reductase family octaheme c-type cytochrome [Spirochaetota bacterium]OQA95809.1 MAG: Cytochrome c bacterial [Spirochaetes bacterium ADurb.Bin218]HPX90572.1 tetrathionate reductase family octaheme c-type cytochrome [Spirochaetota bacterium]